jgi:predicted DNA-binding protein (MmcQ/YjbR family)
MNEKQLRTLLGRWPGVTEDVKWGDHLVFSVANKMFAVYCFRGDHAGTVSFKVPDDRFLEFTDRPGIAPAPYLARAKWIQLSKATVMPAAELRLLLRGSYELVRAKLARKIIASL